MLRELTQLILTKRPAARTCEACGQPFTCGASLTGCWCQQVELTPAVRQELRERYHDCLCPACLAQFSAKAEPPAGGS